MFGYRIVKQRQLYEASRLLSSYETFISIALVDRPKSEAVQFAAYDLQEYKRKWKIK